MPMKLHNTLAHQTEELKTLKPDEVRIYTCGPTVYDRVHLGNFRTYIFEDLLRRTLKSQGIKVNHVLNITDVDDKTIKRSREQYPGEPPKEALSKLTRHYEKTFLSDAKKLGIDFSTSRIARATDHIDDMQILIRQIPNKYVSDDGIYFDIAKDPDYGVLVNLDRQHEHHRINNDEYDKEHVADFALWKVETPDEPSWEFEIDGQKLRGRPGWHIECSAMSTKYLGQPFDIHTGGIDLIFPHHENEIAQSRAADHKPLANYFVHGEHLLVDGKRMAKSSKNFYTVDDLIAKGFDPLAFRLLVLQAHYRSQLNFTWDSLAAAQTYLNRLRAWADTAKQTILPAMSDADASHLIDSVKAAAATDLNSATALALINEFVDKKAPTAKILDEIDKVLGLELTRRPDITDEQKNLIKQRDEARSKNDWEASDRLRNTLSQEGLDLDDTTKGSLWRRR
ncbi:MAG: cysteine--tRNA ligase [Candidatus Saccharimonadales bacterium]